MTGPQTSGYLQSSDPSRPRSNTAVPFRDIIPSPSDPRVAGIADHDALSWCESRRQIEGPAWLINRLDKKNLEAYKGFTNDGKVRKGVYQYAEDEGAPTEKVMKKVDELLGILSDQQRREVFCGEVTDDEFRLWSNPELYVNPGTFCSVLRSGENNNLGRRTPPRRMHTRNPDRHPLHLQSDLLSPRICQSLGVLSHK